MKATCVLHNFLRASDGDEAPAVGHLGQGVEPLRGCEVDDSSAEARRVRDVFKDHFMAEGAVAWQPDA